jgi:PAS domain S-box-containing protein
MPARRIPRGRRRDPQRVNPHVGTRVEAFVRGAELGLVAAVLAAGRDEILRRWLEAARAQPFHAAQRDRAVADHLPHLFDALVTFLQRSAPQSVDPAPPLDDPAVLAAARAHARDRFAQGLRAAEVLTEFRLLRQEIGRELRARADVAADVVGAELLVHDALDGASTLALAALEAHEAERRETEIALRRYAQLLDQAHDAVFTWELRGPINYWNRGAEELYGFSRTLAIGRVSHELLHARPDQVAAFLAALEQNGRWEGELEHTDRAGRTVYVDSRMILVHEERRRHVLESNRDVTERRRAEAEREALIAVLAHDLKTPLTAIKGGAELLRRQAAAGRLTPARAATDARIIDTGVTAAVAQIDELLDSVRLHAGRPLDLVRGPADLVALAQRVAARAQQTTDRHAVTVDVGVPELVGNWDAARLERVLENLLANAVKYSPHGGDITVRVGQEGRRWATVAVQDHGIGIPGADLPYVFERYRRGANVIGQIPGEGIGLAGAQHIVQQHGGALSVESEAGVGSTFTMRLPLARANH